MEFGSGSVLGSVQSDDDHLWAQTEEHLSVLTVDRILSGKEAGEALFQSGLRAVELDFEDRHGLRAVEFDSEDRQGSGYSNISLAFATTTSRTFPSLHTIAIRSSPTLLSPDLSNILVIWIRENSFPVLRTLILPNIMLTWGGRSKERDALDNLCDAFESGCLASLESLDLSHNGIRDPDFKRGLAKALSFLPNLEQLSLSSNKFTLASRKSTKINKWVQLLSLVVNGCHRASPLKLFKISFNPIRLAGHQALAKVLESENLRGFEALIATSTYLDYDAMLAYTQVLQAGCLPAFRRLQIGGNLISDQGAEAIANAISSGQIPRLAYLGISGTYVGDEGVVALANSFKSPHSLTELHFTANMDIGERGLWALAMALERGHLDSLNVLSLQSTRAHISAADALVSALYRNSKLTVDLRLDWFSFPDLELKACQFRDRNIRIAEYRAELQNEAKVPARYGKVYLCGNPMSGKTTMRKSLAKSILHPTCSGLRCDIWFSAAQQQRTRGIEISHLVYKELVLTVWDMAGQEEYHLVHNAFLPDMASARGQATTFVVVCRSKAPAQAGTELRYWMQFISSYTNKSIRVDDPHGFRRHVVVVVNRINGETTFSAQISKWRELMNVLKDEFQHYLDICSEPFIFDVRRRGRVGALKNHLFERTRSMLAGLEVPELCQIIQTHASVWSKEQGEFPVLSWNDFRDKLGPGVALATLEAAAAYMSEVGTIIWIRESFLKEWSVNITSNGLIVLDPNWFCETIVGHMFLPETMLIPGLDSALFQRRVHGLKGSISISSFKQHFAHLQSATWAKWQVEDLLAILLWLGLCYKGREDNIFIPCLIKEVVDPWPGWGRVMWDDNASGQWVMGYSVEHAMTEVTLAPVAVFHRFQVELAQTPAFNGQPDNDFVVGKYFVSFKASLMAVLVEVNVSDQHPTFDRIDILVKPLIRPDCDIALDKRKAEQVNLARAIAEILLKLCLEFCPGIEFTRKVIWPWHAHSSRRHRQADRDMDVMQLKEVVRSQGPGRPMNWDVDGEPICAEQLLSNKEIKGILDELQKPFLLLEEGVTLGIFPSDAVEDELPVSMNYLRISSEKLHSSTSPTADAGANNIVRSGDTAEEKPDLRILEEHLVGISQQMRDLSQKVSDVLRVNYEVRDLLKASFQEQKNIFRKVHSMEKIFMDDRHNSWPRFLYLGKSSGSWLTLRKAMAVQAKVFFLCEARYDDNDIHPVKNQKGVDVHRLKDWARKLAPCLKVGLGVCFVLAKAAAGVVAPGLGLIIPDFQAWQQMATLSDALAQVLGCSSKELEAFTEKDLQELNNGSVHSYQEVYGQSRKHVAGLLADMTSVQFSDYVGLTKVALLNRDNSIQGCVWICEDCYSKYKSENRVTDL